MSYIELKDVKKIYKMGEVNINALSGVNFSVEKGEFVIIAGASGAGKVPSLISWEAWIRPHRERLL